jgi:hypothetical protein
LRILHGCIGQIGLDYSEGIFSFFAEKKAGNRGLESISLQDGNKRRCDSDTETFHKRLRVNEVIDPVSPTPYLINSITDIALKIFLNVIVAGRAPAYSRSIGG